MTREQLESRLRTDLDAGRITAEEADLEFADFVHRDEVWREW